MLRTYLISVQLIHTGAVCPMQVRRRGRIEEGEKIRLTKVTKVPKVR